MGGRRAAASPTTLRLTLTEREFVFARWFCGKAAGSNLSISREQCELHALWRVRLLDERPGTGCRRIARIPALAAPKHDREGDQRQLIDEVCGKQGLVEHAAALDEQVRSIAGLEARDSLGGIADEALAVVPRQRLVRRCHDMLANGIKRLADRLVAVVGPVSGEDLVGSPAKQQLIAAAQQSPHRLLQRVVEIGEQPAAVRKAGLVLLRPAWCLDHAVERLEKGADDLTHRRLLRAPQPRSGRCRSCAWSSSLRMLAWPRPCQDCCWPAAAHAA